MALWLRQDRNQERLFWALVLTSYLVTRLVGMQPYLGDLDSIDFALGLRDYDLSRFQPHFPGYPVYMLLARGLYAVGVSAPAALELPGIIVGGAALGVFHAGCRRWLSVFGARVATLLWLTCPGLWLAAGQPSSDSLGLASFTIPIALLAVTWGSGKVRPRRWSWTVISALAGLGIGLALGVRVSYWPIAVSACVAVGSGVRTNKGRIESVGAFLLGSVGGTLLWLVPMAFVVGARHLMNVAMAHTLGHFTAWGGGLGVQSAPGIAERVSMLMWNLFAHGLGAGLSVGPSGMVLILLIVVAGAGVLTLRAAPRNCRAVASFLTVVAVPYVIWIIVGQNPEKPRHVLPLIPVVLVALASCIPPLFEGGIRARWIVALSAGALLATMAWMGGERIWRARVVPSPALQLVEHVASHVDPEGTVVYGGEEIRLFAYYAPWFRAKRVSGNSNIIADSEGGIEPKRILVTSKVFRGQSDRPAGLRHLETFSREPMINPHYAEIELFEMTPDDVLGLRAESAQR